MGETWRKIQNPALFFSDDDDSSSGDSAVYVPEPLVAPGEWTYFGRQVFRDAVLQLLSADLTESGQRGQAKGGVLDQVM